MKLKKSMILRSHGHLDSRDNNLCDVNLNNKRVILKISYKRLSTNIVDNPVDRIMKMQQSEEANQLIKNCTFWIEVNTEHYV